MTYRRWWVVRQFLFDERFGSLIRQAELEQRAEEERLAAQYRRSVSHLRAVQEP